VCSSFCGCCESHSSLPSAASQPWRSYGGILSSDKQKKELRLISRHSEKNIAQIHKVQPSGEVTSLNCEDVSGQSYSALLSEIKKAAVPLVTLHQKVWKDHASETGQIPWPLGTNINAPISKKASAPQSRKGPRARWVPKPMKSSKDIKHNKIIPVICIH